ncbi:hypothetical protein [Streptomyces sp. N35]|uniref:DUF7691 family protein n=1 Tax=Streptomyces sp. N35 TaxID=2795730 RepID=UPI0018F6E7D2|nr:hypothetical protein [Streptomyces sp. N35]
MSHIISYSIAEQRRLLPYLGGELNADQQRILDIVRSESRAYQAELERQDIDLGLTISDALEHLAAGRADAEGEYAGQAYYTALTLLMQSIGSDIIDYTVYSKPSTFFGLLDDELRRAGVPADLLPHDYFYAGPPDEIGFSIPTPPWGYPAIGRWPLAKAKPAADAYRAVLDRVDDSFAYDLNKLIEMLDLEHTVWQDSLDNDHHIDTLFFYIGG